MSSTRSAAPTSRSGVWRTPSDAASSAGSRRPPHPPSLLPCRSGPASRSCSPPRARNAASPAAPPKAKKRKRPRGRDPLYNSARDIRRLQQAKRGKLDKAQQIDPSAGSAAVEHPPSEPSPPPYRAAEPSSAAVLPFSALVSSPPSQSTAPSSVQLLANLERHLAGAQLQCSSLRQIVANEVAVAVAAVIAQHSADRLRWKEEVEALQANCQQAATECQAAKATAAEAKATAVDLRRRLDETEEALKAELRRRAPAQRTAMRYLSLIQRCYDAGEEGDAGKAGRPPAVNESLDLALEDATGAL